MGSGSRKTNPLINMISWETDIDKVYLFAKNPKKAKYQLLINKREKRGSKRIFNLRILWIFTKKCTAKLYSFLVIGCSLLS